MGFRYTVHNGQQVLIKRASEGVNLPYIPISLEILGAITPLKTTHKNPNESSNDDEANPDEESIFHLPGRSHRRKNYVPKEQIFQNLTAVLNGFEASQKYQDRV